MNAPFSTMTPDAPQVITFTPAMRRLVCDAIEAMILLLDEIDGDVDHEQDPDFEQEPDLEPSLGAFELVNQEKSWRTTDSGWGGQDLELDEADKEPSLGAPERHPELNGWAPLTISGSQVRWADAGLQDIELDHSDFEPDVDAEPDGAPFVMVQI
jgi:hypothetical protein